MDIKTLVEEAKVNGYYDDLIGIARRLLPEQPAERVVYTIADFIIKYKQMWHDVGNEDTKRQYEEFRNYQPFYADSDHSKKNQHLRAVDYLETFKGFMRKWALRTSGIDANDSWYKAQSELASFIYAKCFERSIY